MLNLSQRLILGCLLLVCLTAGLAAAAHRALVAAGQGYLSFAFIVLSLLVAAATIFFVLLPIHTLARDAHRIAQGNLEHRVEWNSRDDFGAIAGDLARIATRLRDSPTLSLRPSANAATRRAAPAPGQPEARASASAKASGSSPARSAPSAVTTAASKDTERARSTTVRASEVTGIPPSSMTSSPTNGPVCR